MNLQAIIYDMDGVITDTAALHLQAWQAMFNEFLQTHQPAERFSERDYYECVDGKPRLDGIRCFLATKGIELPLGDPADAADRETLYGLGHRKNTLFKEKLVAEGVVTFPGTLRLLSSAKELGILAAVVSSSKNCAQILQAAGLFNEFQVCVDGVTAEHQQIAGKPAPDMFLYAANQLAIHPTRAVVIEDAISGVAAASAGDFGLIVGIDRWQNQRQRLLDSGADIVVSDVGELTVQMLANSLEDKGK